MPQYKRLGQHIGEWTGTMYRFYCTVAAWPYSPAARGGATYAEEG